MTPVKWVTFSQSLGYLDLPKIYLVYSNIIVRKSFNRAVKCFNTWSFKNHFDNDHAWRVLNCLGHKINGDGVFEVVPIIVRYTTKVGHFWVIFGQMDETWYVGQWVTSCDPVAILLQLFQCLESSWGNGSKAANLQTKLVNLFIVYLYCTSIALIIMVYCLAMKIPKSTVL